VTLTALAVILGAVALGAFAKGLTGLGLPLIAVPVMASFLGVERAVVVMAIPTAVTNSWLMWEYRRYATETRDMPVVLLCGAVGTVAGVWVLTALDPRVMAGVLAAVIGVYIVVFLAHPALRLSPRVTRYLSPGVGVGSGVLQGATGISGPTVGTYFHGFRLPQGAYVLSITSVFQVFALVQIVVFASLGLYTTERVLESLVALVPIMAILPIGVRVSRRLAQRPFEIVVLVILGLMGVKLLADAVGL
jgi:uncharacterized protein